MLLQALWFMIHDDCDMDVTKEAGKLITKMINIIKKFNIPINNSEISIEPCGEGDKNRLKRKYSSESSEKELKLPVLFLDY